MAQKKVYDNVSNSGCKARKRDWFQQGGERLGINTDTLYGWNKRAKDVRLNLGLGTQTPDSAMSLTEEVHKLRQQNKEQVKEINRLKEENEFLAEEIGRSFEA